MSEQQKTSGHFQDRVTFGQLLVALRRNAVWMVLLFVAINGFVVWTAFTLPPVYRASATVVLDTRGRKVAPVQAVLSPVEASVAVVQTEMETLRSPELTQRVIDGLGVEVASSAIASTPYPLQQLDPKLILSQIISALGIQKSEAIDDADYGAHSLPSSLTDRAGK